MQVPHGLPSVVEDGEGWAEVRVARKQRRRVSVYESFMIGIQGKRSVVVKYSTAGARNEKNGSEGKLR